MEYRISKGVEELKKLKDVKNVKMGCRLPKYARITRPHDWATVRRQERSGGDYVMIGSYQ